MLGRKEKNLHTAQMQILPLREWRNSWSDIGSILFLKLRQTAILLVEQDCGLICSCICGASAVRFCVRPGTEKIQIDEKSQACLSTKFCATSCDDNECSSSSHHLPWSWHCGPGRDYTMHGPLSARWGIHNRLHAARTVGFLSAHCHNISDVSFCRSIDSPIQVTSARPILPSGIRGSCCC